jgi:HK97 family phage major capsid protein
VSISVSAQQEIMDLQRQCEEITKKPLTPESRKRFDLNLSKLSLLRSGQLSDDVRNAQADALAEEFGLRKERPTEEQRTKREQEQEFREFIRTGYVPEKRTYQPMDSIDASLGGFLCPAEYQAELFTGISGLEPLFSENNVRFVRTVTGRSTIIPGIDLSAMNATIANQNSQSVPSTVPVVSKNTLGAYTYRVNPPIAVTLEIEQDSTAISIPEVLKEAFTVAFSLGIGADLISGNGISAPQGLLTGATDSTITTASHTAIVASELLSVYFSLPRIQRANPKTAWVISDEVYELLRKAVDGNSRPLLNVVNDQEVLLGKKVLVSPSLSASKFILANLSNYVVRVATDSVRVVRSLQAGGFIENGLALMTCSMRVDAKLIQPASSVPVAVFGTIHS